VKKTAGGVTTKYLVDTQNPTGYAQVVYGGTGNHELSHTYADVYGLESISQFRSYILNNASHTQTSYYVYDGHGSTRALTDPAGVATDTYDYDAFGNLLHSTATGITPGGTTVTATPNEFLFAGEQFDSDLNLYYNRARYLKVSTGRFWTMDSDEGNSADPLSLHKYLFAEANAVDNSDASGNEIDEVIGSFSVSATIDAMPTVLRTAIQAVKHALPYSVVVVTPSSGATYEPKSKVKNRDQASVSGWPVGTPIRIAVPPAINPQTMVDDWSSKSAWNPRTWLEFKRTWSDPANNFKR